MLKKLKLPLIVVVSSTLIVFALTPVTPPHSQAVSAAWAKSVQSPSEETRRDWQNVLDDVNRPLHVLQYFSGLSGLALLSASIWWWRAGK
jgi:hypothetical protein